MKFSQHSSLPDRARRGKLAARSERCMPKRNPTKAEVVKALKRVVGAPEGGPSPEEPATRRTKAELAAIAKELVEFASARDRDKPKR